MAVFDRIPQDVIERDFQYYGLFLGCVPVYIGDPDGACNVAVRNWIPEWTLDFAQASLDFFSSMGLVNGSHFMIRITGQIRKGGEQS